MVYRLQMKEPVREPFLVPSQIAKQVCGTLKYGLSYGPNKNGPSREVVYAAMKLVSATSTVSRRLPANHRYVTSARAV